MIYWTLIYGGTEKALASWGVTDDFAREKDNKGRGTVTLRTTELFDSGATQWLAQQPAQIWRDRVGSADGSFSGGTLWAQGFWDDPERQNAGGVQHCTYKLHNVWWLLEQHFYQQPRNVVVGITDGVATLANIFTPEVFLGEAVVPGELTGYITQMQTNGAEITEILNWVNECFNPTKRGATSGRNNAQDVLAIGTIDPQLFIGIKRVAAVLCSEAIIDVLRLQPDSIVWVDDTTTPPTVNVRTLGKWTYGALGTPPTFIDYTNLPEVVINITEQQETKILQQAQTWKQLPAVVIFWWGTNTIGGTTQPFCYVDDYPNGITVTDGINIPNDGYIPRASVHFIALQGASETIETALVNTEPLATLLGGDQAAQVAWWQAHDLTLGDPLIDPATIVVGTPTVLSDAGVAIDTGAYPNILLDTHLPGWAAGIGLNWMHATIRATVACTRYADAGHKILETKPRIRTIHKRVKVTNAGSQTYTAITSVTGGDTIPLGIAKSLYLSTNALQWAGSIEFVQAQLRSDITFGNRYTLVGPNTTFSNCLPQRIVERPCEGKIDMTFGPAPAASIDALLEIARATRFRTTWRLPSGRDTGQDAAGQTDTGANAPTDDTAHSPGGDQMHGVTFPDSVTPGSAI